MSLQVERCPICYWDEMVRYHHQIKEHEFEQTLGESGGQEPGCQNNLVTE